MRDWLLAVDPELVAAATEVDGALFARAERMRPLARLDEAGRLAEELRRFRRHG